MVTLCPFYDDDYAVILLCRTLVFLRRPVIVSQPEHLVVDNGMTISLPCIVDQIPGDDCFTFLSLFLVFVPSIELISISHSAGVQIMWQKLDSKKTIIAVGETVIDPQVR